MRKGQIEMEIKNGDYINIIYMSKGQRKRVIYCLEHEFSLTPLKLDVYLKQTAILSYCRGKIQSKAKGHQKKNQNEGNCSCCPIFNKDRNHATNSFILPQEQKNFIENSQKLKLEHDCRVCDYNDEKSKILIPKPKTRYSYCNVCRTSYDDYLQHIQNQTHKNHLTKSRFNNYIKDLVKKYEGKDRMKKISSKSTEAPSTTFYNFPQSDLNMKDMGRPSKKVKVSKQGVNQINNSNKTQVNSAISGIPLHPFGSNMLYPPLSYQSIAQIPRSLQLMPAMAPGFGPLNSLSYHMNCMMLGGPCFCWNPYHAFYSNISYNQYKPLVIDLQQKQD